MMIEMKMDKRTITLIAKDSWQRVMAEVYFKPASRYNPASEKREYGYKIIDGPNNFGYDFGSLKSKIFFELPIGMAHGIISNDTVTGKPLKWEKRSILNLFNPLMTQGER